MEQTTKNQSCEICGGVTYTQIDDRAYCEVGNPRKPPTLKCLGCGFTIKNCDCLNV